MILIAVPLLAIMLAGIYWQRKAILGRLAALHARLTVSTGLLYTFVLCKAALVTVVFLFSWAITEHDPVVVYMRF